MIEIFSEIDGFNGTYLISNYGRLYSFNKKSYMIPQLNTSGYYNVVLSDKKHYYIHRLVATYFICNHQNKRYVNHIDGNKLNNIFTNLEWVTASENLIHAYNLGLQPRQKRTDALNNNFKHGRDSKYIGKRPCEYCKKYFSGGFVKTRFCSKSCSTKYQNKKRSKLFHSPNNK